jgi:hypothetical protein
MTIAQVFYYRIQGAEDNELMVNSGRVGGRAPRNIYASPFPKVKAFVGRLPSDRRGIEFTTDVIPDVGNPPGPRDLVGRTARRGDPHQA